MIFLVCIMFYLIGMGAGWAVRDSKAERDWRTPMPDEQPPAIRVLSWDHREQPDLRALGRAITDLSGGQLHLTSVEVTGTQDYAIVLSDAPIDQQAATEAYRRWDYLGEGSRD